MECVCRTASTVTGRRMAGMGQMRVLNVSRGWGRGRKLEGLG